MVKALICIGAGLGDDTINLGGSTNNNNQGPGGFSGDTAARDGGSDTVIYRVAQTDSGSFIPWDGGDTQHGGPSHYR